MNKKKIVISIVFISIISLALLGITFGYYYTQIIGNSSSKSVQFTAKKDAIEYKELSDEVIGEVIEPGFEYIKLFAATNVGDAEASYHIYLDEVVNEFIRTQDITYTLYRKSGYNTITASDLSDCEIISSGEFPKTDNYIKLNEVLSTPGNSYTYALKINYVNSTENQDIDKGHIFGFKVQYHGEFINPYLEGTLAYNIINNSFTKKNDTELVVTPPTKPAEEINGSTEKVLSFTNDDYGISYYYRGGVEDNYVNFAGMCWRIVRIEGDGSTKLILEDQDSTCATSNGNWDIPTTTGGTTKTGNFGHTEYAANTLTASDGTKNSSRRYLMNYLNGGTDNTSSMAYAFKNFQTGPLLSYLSYLKAGDWCLNDKAYDTRRDNTTALTSQEMLDKQIKSTTFYYDSYVRLNGKTTKEPTLKCNGTNMSKFADNTDMYVGTLTADEIVYAGGKYSSSNPNYYLLNQYQRDNNLYWWSLSPSNFNSSNDFAFNVSSDGYLNYSFVNLIVSFRPAVFLKSSVQITGGDGTKANAYTIG